MGIFSSIYFTKNKNPVSVNKAAKNDIRKWYSQYYSNEVQRQLAACLGTHYFAVHLRLSALKAKYANWIVEIYYKFQSDKGVTIIKIGFRKSDITEAIEMVEFPEHPF